MKCKFSSRQTTPFVLLLCGAVLLCILDILVSVFVPSNLFYILMLAVLALSCTLAALRFRLAAGYVRIDEDGVLVLSASGKRVRRKILWEEAATLATATDGDHMYLCLTANPALPAVRKYPAGAVYALFFDRQTISFPVDAQIAAACAQKAQVYGVTTEHNDAADANPEVEKSRQAGANRSYLIALGVLLIIAVLVTVFC